MRQTYNGLVRLPTSWRMWTMALGAGAIGTAASVAPPSPRQADPTPPTFRKDVAPLIHRSCVPCHRPGGAAPFALETYRQVVQNSELVRIQTMIGAMPPCRETSDFGSFCSTQPLDDAELLTLQRWFQAKMPEGEGKLPLKTRVPNRWTLGTPDVILASPKALPKTRTEGARYWQAIVMEAPKGGIDLRAFEVQPNDPQALRTVLVAVAPEGSLHRVGTMFETAGSLDLPGSQLVGVWSPASRAWSLPKGAAIRIPAGSRLIVQVHYQPLGKPADAGFQLGMHKAQGPQTWQTEWITLAKERFRIEAKAAPTFAMSTTLPSDALIVSMLPEARFYASRVRITATPPEGQSKLLFETYRWDPYWVGNYRFAEPPRFPAGTRIEASINYNNDESCPMNEGRVPEPVDSGPLITNEVCRVHILTLRPLPKNAGPRKLASPHR